MHMISGMIFVAILVCAILLLAYTIDTRILLLVPISAAAYVIGESVDSIFGERIEGAFGGAFGSAFGGRGGSAGYDCHGGDLYVLDDGLGEDPGVYPEESLDPDDGTPVANVEQQLHDHSLSDNLAQVEAEIDADNIDSDIDFARATQTYGEAAEREVEIAQPLGGGVRDGGAPPPSWLRADVDRFRATYYGVRTKKYETMIRDMLNCYVDRGQFVAQSPDWLVATDDDVGASAGAATYTLDLDGWDQDAGICYEYQGPLHYEYLGEPDMQDREFRAWIRARQNDDVKARLIREHGQRLVLIHYKCVSGDPRDRIALTDATIERYVRYVVSRLAEIGALSDRVLQSVVPGVATPSAEQVIAGLREYQLWARAVGEPARAHNTHIKTTLVNRKEHIVVSRRVLDRQREREARHQQERENAAKRAANRAARGNV